MDDLTLFEDRFEERLRAFARTGVQSVDSAAVARTVATGHPRSAPARLAGRRLENEVRTGQRAVVGPRSTRSMFKTALGAAAVIALLVGATLFLSRPSEPAVGVPGPTVSASASPSQPALVVAPSPTSMATPSPTPTATPSPTLTPIMWTQASLKEDWPAPVRAEPVEGAIVEPILLRYRHGALESDRHIDPSGDAGSDVLPWVDIDYLAFCGSACLYVDLVSDGPPVVDPSEQWIAYGVVVDDDRDGVPDRRFGIDNIPGGQQRREHRQWVTDLHTGRTLVGYDLGGTFFDTFYPGEIFSAARLSFGGDATSATGSGGTVGGLPERFYAWASVIQDGRVVATDYAPDVGWLHASPDAKP